MMLRHGFGRAEDAARIEAAVDAVLARGLRTADLASGTVVDPPTGGRDGARGDRSRNRGDDRGGSGGASP